MMAVSPVAAISTMVAEEVTAGRQRAVAPKSVEMMIERRIVGLVELKIGLTRECGDWGGG